MWSLTHLQSATKIVETHLSDVLATSKTENEASRFPPSPFPTHSQQCCAAVEVKSVGNFPVILLKLVNSPFLTKQRLILSEMGGNESF